MKNYFLTLALTLAFASAYGVEPTPGNTSQSDAAANATGGAVYMAPISASPTITVSPINDVHATNGPIANTATTGPVSATANPVATGTANSTATANPIVSPTISPTITGGNSSATGGNAALTNAGNATLNGSVSGTNTLNGTVSGTNTNNVRNDLTNHVGVTSNNANLNNVNATTGNNTNTLNGGSVVDNSKTTNTLVGGMTTATGTANVNVGDQMLHNVNNVSASGGQGGAGGKGGESSSISNANSLSKVENSGNSHSTSGVTNSGNSQSISGVNNSGNSSSNSSTSSTAQGGKVDNVGNVSNAGNSSVVINNPKPLPPAPGVVVPNASAPTLFEQHGLPANAKAVNLVLNFMRACPSTYVKGVELREVREKGSSGLTNLIFTPHSNYAKYGNKGDVHMSQVVEIPTNAKVGEHRYLCLGLIQSEALAKNASEVPPQTIVNDAVQFAGDELKGFNKINLVFIPKEALSVNMGLNAAGNGLGISPGASGMWGSVLATLVGGFTTNSGYTFPAAQLGGTFIVVAEGDFPDAAPHIDFAPPVPVVSIEQGQLDAIKRAQEEAITAKQAVTEETVALRQALSQAEAARNIAEAKVAMTEEKMVTQQALNQAEAARQIAEAKVAMKAQPAKVKKVKKASAKPQCKPCESK